MDVEERRAAWDAVAGAWEARRESMWESSRAVGERMVELLAPEPGQTVLELAAGIGETGLAAAARIGPKGLLIATDFSPNMVEGARRRAGELGVENVEFLVLDAERMDLDDDAVDGVLCRFGYMLMPDPAAALAETRRVLRPGGRLCFAVWGPREQNPWITVIGGVLLERGHMPPPEPDEPGVFALADRGRIASLLSGAGFEPHAVEEVAVSSPYADVDEYWSSMLELAGGMGSMIRALPPEEQESIRAAIGERAAAFARGGGIVLPGVALVVLAS